MSKRFALGLALAAALAATAVPSGAAPARRLTAAKPAAAASARPTAVMVVGASKVLLAPRSLKFRAATVRIGRRRCPVPAGTALAGLLAARLAVVVTDVGGCDPGSMFVTSIGGEHNHGHAGWEYKVGHGDPSFGAADPGGRLRAGQELLWYWCVSAEDCQRTLALSTAFKGSTLQVHVFGYDQNGHRQSIAGATVRYGTHDAPTDAHGHAAFALVPGAHNLYASKPGLVRSFPTRVGVVS